MRPLGNRVLVEPQEVENKTSSGILLSSPKNQRTQRGTVVAVGRGAISMSGEVIPMEVEEGEEVVFNKTEGIEMESDDGEKVILLHESDIFCVL